MGTLLATAIPAQDRLEYARQSIARYVEAFAWLDANRNGQVTKQEAQGNIEFTATFDDIDINRDDVVTKAELDRFLAQRFGQTPKDRSTLIAQ